FSDKPLDAENDKATAETKVESMVSVTIQQDMSSIPPMTSPIIDLTLRPESPKPPPPPPPAGPSRASRAPGASGSSQVPPPPPPPSSTNQEKQVLLEDPVSSSGTLSSLQHLSKDISFGDLFFSDKPLDAENDKATAETKVESMVSVTIQQNMSSIPPMTSPIIDLTLRPESPKVHQQFKATTTKTTITTTTTTLPPPPAQQQSTAEAMMMKRISKLEHIMANLIQENKGLEERTAASTEYQAWTTTDIRLMPSISLTSVDLKIDEDMGPDEQAQSSNDEDIKRAHIPKVKLRQDWWKPLEEE
nr:hypothetical protein [Tanacetum cinerariifolium]